MPASTQTTLALALLSGAAALSHELLWTRRLIDLLGGTGEATSRVFGCFFLGLAIGAILAARMLPRVRSAWLAIAYCEAAIALLCLPALTLPWWSDGLWPALGPDRLIGWEGAAAKALLSIAVVLPPAVPMGMTLPCFAAAMLSSRGNLARQGVLLYGVNTLGGVVGLVVTSTVLLTRFGVIGSMAAAASVNAAVGVAAFVIHRGSGDPTTPPPNTPREKRRRRQAKTEPQAAPLPLRPALLLSFASGLAMLILELLSIRLLGFVVPSSVQATVAVLVAVILLLAVAAIAFPLLLRCYASPRAWLLVSLVGASFACAAAPWMLYRGSGELSQVTLPGGAAPASSAEFTFAVCVLALATVGPALLLGGMVLPSVFGWVGGDEGDRGGRGLGYLLAANGVGGILGAELTGAVVLPHFGVYGGFATVAAVYAVAAVGVLRPWAVRGFATPIAACAALLGPLSLWGAVSQSVPYLNPTVAKAFAYDDADDVHFGRDGVLLVVEHPTQGRGILVNNQYLLGGAGLARDERREVLLPMLLHPNPERVGCVGLATGISAGAALDAPATKELVAVEISRLVADVAKARFGDFNRDLADDPRAQIVVEDGRTYVASCVDRFDVLVGDLYRPYGAGEGRLYSVEHFRATRRALRSGGLFCQWLPMYQLTEAHFGVIVASFLKAYPDAELIRANHNADNPMLGLVGAKDTPVDLTELASRCAELRAGGRVDDDALLSPQSARRFYVGPIDPDRFAPSRLNTLDNALVELLAGRRRVTQAARGETASGQAPYLRDDAWRRFEDRLPTRVLR